MTDPTSTTEHAPTRYISERTPDEAPTDGEVAIFAEYSDGRREQIRLVVYHSPSGLEYGYAGSGPADTALSILAHFYGVDPVELAKKIRTASMISDNYTEEERRAVRWHQDFKWAHVATADRSQPFLIYVREIVTFIADQLAKERT